MPTQKYAIEPNGPKRLEISWTGMWNDFTVKLDGADVAKVSKDDVKAGKEMSLPDGSTFKVHLRRAGMSTELALLRNGAPLPGSSADPTQLIKTAGGIVYFLAALQTVLGVVALVGNVEFLLNLGLGVESIIEGAIMGALGFFTMKRSRVALGLAMVLFIIGGVMTIASATAAGGTPPVGGIIFRVLLLTAMWRGFKAMGQLKQQETTQTQPGSIANG
jgi:hypothetical protein